MATKKIAKFYDANGDRLYTDAVDIIDRSSGANFSEHVANKKVHAQWTYKTDNEEDTNAKLADAPEGAIFVEGGSVLKQKVNGVAEEVDVTATGDAEVEVSQAEGNVLEMKDDGLFVEQFDDSNVVHKTGTEQIDGLKVFTHGINYDSKYWLNLQNSELDQAAEESGKYGFVLNVTDSKGVANSTIFSSVNKNGSELLLRAGINGTKAVLSVKDVKDGDAVATAPTPPANSNTNHIATTGWVRTNIDANVVHKTGNETVEGLKTFTSPLITTAGIAVEEKNANVDLTVAPEAVEITYPLRVLDKNGKRYAVTQTRQTPDKVTEHNMFVFNNAGQAANLSLAITDDGKAYANTVTPDANSNADHIATTKWVRENIDANVVHKTGNETIDGTKTFSKPIYVISDGPGNIGLRNTTLDINVIPSSYQTVGGTFWNDKNGKNFGSITMAFGSSGNSSIEMRAINKDGTTGMMGVKMQPDGVTFGFAPTPDAANNSTAIATTEWVRGKIQYGTNDIGAGSALDTGAIYLVYEE